MFAIENKEKDQSDSLFGENPLVLISSSAVYCEVRRLLNLPGLFYLNCDSISALNDKNNPVSKNL